MVEQLTSYTKFSMTSFVKEKSKLNQILHSYRKLNTFTNALSMKGWQSIPCHVHMLEFSKGTLTTTLTNQKNIHSKSSYINVEEQSMISIIDYNNILLCGFVHYVYTKNLTSTNVLLSSQEYQFPNVH